MLFWLLLSLLLSSHESNELLFNLLCLIECLLVLSHCSQGIPNLCKKERERGRGGDEGEVEGEGMV